jgi:hypothetical protein
MKIIIGFILLVFPGLVIYAQQVKAVPATPPAPKVLAEIATGPDRVVKDAPFSAEAVSESVQTLADGNRIVRRWTEKLYRSSDGKFRREGTGGPGSAFGTVIMANPSVTILDPQGGARYTLNTDNKTARTYTLRTPAPIIINRDRQDKAPIILNGEGGPVATTVPLDRLKTEINTQVELRAVETAKAAAVIAATPVTAPVTSTNGQKWETRTEQLGVQNFEGVDAEGTRTITTIPADAIGNERPIEIVYERWYSKELQMVVYSRHFDPRFGEQTYRLTNINRSEPDPSLFTVPTSYRILNQLQYKTTTSPRVATEKPVVSKTPQASRP